MMSEEQEDKPLDFRTKSRDFIDGYWEGWGRAIRSERRLREAEKESSGSKTPCGLPGSCSCASGVDCEIA